MEILTRRPYWGPAFDKWHVVVACRMRQTHAGEGESGDVAKS